MPLPFEPMRPYVLDAGAAVAEKLLRFASMTVSEIVKEMADKGVRFGKIPNGNYDPVNEYFRSVTGEESLEFECDDRVEILANQHLRIYWSHSAENQSKPLEIPCPKQFIAIEEAWIEGYLGNGIDYSVARAIGTPAMHDTDDEPFISKESYFDQLFDEVA